MAYAGPASRGTAIPIDSSARAAESLAPPRQPRQSMRLARRSVRSNGTVMLVAGVAIGLAIGAGAALLFAPQAGADTRHDIARRGRRLGQRGRDAWDDLAYELKRVRRQRRHRRDERRG